MTKKRKRLEDELKKLIAKKAEVEARITETQDQIQEETNIEIHEMVHAAHLTPEQLADVLAAFRKGSIPVNMHSADCCDDRSRSVHRSGFCLHRRGCGLCGACGYSR